MGAPLPRRDRVGCHTGRVHAYPALVRRLGRHRWFTALGRAVVPVDRALTRATRGRFTLIGPRIVPQLLLTTTGRRSGEPRTSPLLYARDGAAYVVAGSNWGQPRHPAWSANLLADAVATVTVGGVAIRVVATLANGAERERLWALMVGVWPAYDDYAARSGRDIRVFRLDPAVG